MARPAVFVHGLWLHATSWQPWLDLFAQRGYDPVAPGWPHEPPTVAEARSQPDAVAGLGIEDVADHYAGINLGAAAVAIDPAQIRGVLVLPPAQLRASGAVLGNPANAKRAVSLTAAQFRYGFGNAVSQDESDVLFERWTIPSPAKPLFEAATANFVAHSPAAVDTRNSRRGPLLLISGGKDHTVPDAVTRSTFKQYRHSSAVTELRQFPDRGHSLVIDNGWREIADATLEWLDKALPAP